MYRKYRFFFSLRECVFKIKYIKNLTEILPKSRILFIPYQKRLKTPIH